MQSGSSPEVKDYYRGISTPNVSEMELQLQHLVEQGVLTPEDIQAIDLESSDMNNISTDPRFKQNQMDALLGLQEISDAGGMTDSDLANLNRIKTEEDTAARGKRDAIIQNANARGVGGSGLELMDQLMNEQEAATRKSQRDLDVTGMAQKRALEALIQGGQLSGQMQNQDFNQQAQIAGANDAISKFNAQNQQSIMANNVNARNEAAATNLANKQNVYNANVGLNNQQQQYNKQLLQQNYENKLKRAAGQSGVAQVNANAQGQNSQNSANASNQLIGIGATVAGTYFGGPAGGAAANAAVNSTAKKKDGGLVMGDPSDQDTMPHMLQPGEMVVKKDDVPEMMKKKHTSDDGDFDVAGFLDDITGNKYGYAKGNKK